MRQPVVYLVNMSAEDYIRKKNKHLAKIHKWVQVLPLSLYMYVCMYVFVYICVV